MPNIAFIHHRFNIDGISTITRNLARYLASNAPEYKIFIFVDSLADSRLADGMEVNCELVAVSSLLAAVKRYDIDILVELTCIEKGIEEIKNVTGCKVVYADHGQPFNEQYAIIDRRMGGRRRLLFKKVMWKLFLKRIYIDGGKARRLAVERARGAYRHADAYVVLCEAYKDELTKEFGPDVEEKLAAIENPVIRNSGVYTDKENLVIFAGRLSYYDKRVDRLLRIWKKVQHDIPGWKLEIVGDGFERRRLEEMALDLGLERVSFEGMQRDMDKYYRRASIICLVSRTEGWGMCLTEGQSYGVIPVAFDCSAGVHTVISPNGENGFLVPPADEDEFARTLLNVIALPEEEKHRIRLNCMQKASEYTVEDFGKKWLDLLDRLSSQLGK